MRRVTISEFQAELMAQGVSGRNHLAVRCPTCGTVQSIDDFIAAGDSPKEAERFIGWSCIGRRTGAGPYREGKSKPGAGCDWTLGGLFTIHKLEVIDENGASHPRFEPATPAQAQAHEASKQTRAA